MTAETAEDSSLLELSEENERLTEDTCSVERNTGRREESTNILMREEEHLTGEDCFTAKQEENRSGNDR